MIYGNNEIHISEVDGIYEYDHPLEVLNPLPYGEVEERSDSSWRSWWRTVPPSSWESARSPTRWPTFSDKRDLGVHMEMITNSILELVEAGVGTDGKREASTRALSWAPSAAAPEALRLYGPQSLRGHAPVQVCEQSPRDRPELQDGFHQHGHGHRSFGPGVLREHWPHAVQSGSGGQVDTVTGAIHATGGKSVIALASTTKNGEISKICLTHAPGSGDAVQKRRGLRGHRVRRCPAQWQERERTR